jgi:hypothetical protein
MGEIKMEETDNRKEKSRRKKGTIKKTMKSIQDLMHFV